MTDPTEISPDEAVRRVTFDVAERDLDFLERYAAYRNALAAETKRNLRAQWSTKSLAESALAAQCSTMREQLREMVAALGELPPKDDKEAVRAYVRRVIAWDKRTNR